MTMGRHTSKMARVGIGLAILYLAVGVFVYGGGLRSQRQLRVCPPEVIWPEHGTTIPDCPRQSVNLSREITTAPTIIIGWLPLMLGQMFSARDAEVVKGPAPQFLADTADVPGLGVFHDSPVVDNLKSFSSESFGISFLYPAQYALFENESTYGDGITSYHYFTMMPKETVRHIIENKLETEWPPGFGIALYQKPSDFTTLEDWIRTHRESNFINEEWADTTLTEAIVAGMPATRYRGDGLYTYEYVAFDHGGRIIRVSLAKETGEDFEVFLDSIQFTQ